MIESDSIRAMISLYAKHGWVLRRVLLSEESRTLGDTLFNSVPITINDFDALWFSRRSKENAESWELRRVYGTPFALVTVIADGLSEEDRYEVFMSTEEQMRDSISKTK